MKLPKIVIQGKAEQKNNREFKVKGNSSKEKDIVLKFGRDKKYKVDKLDTTGLPDTIKSRGGDSDKKVVWLNNFQVSGEYTEGEAYSVLLPTIDGGQDIVWFDGEFAHYYDGEVKDTVYEGVTYKEITLTTGDPGGGWVIG